MNARNKHAFFTRMIQKIGLLLILACFLVFVICLHIASIDWWSSARSAVPAIFLAALTLAAMVVMAFLIYWMAEEINFLLLLLWEKLRLLIGCKPDEQDLRKKIGKGKWVIVGLSFLVALSPITIYDFRWPSPQPFANTVGLVLLVILLSDLFLLFLFTTLWFLERFVAGVHWLVRYFIT